MIQEKIVNWNEFKEEISLLTPDVNERGIQEPWVFRGHRHSDWQLQSTLERELIYHRKEYPQQYKYETYVNTLRGFINDESIKKKLEKGFSSEDFKDFKYEDILACRLDLQYFYDFIIFMRHFGFPSPILDWTKNFAVAAYFAFKADEKIQDAEYVAIYALKYHQRAYFYYEGCPYIRYIDPMHEHSERHIRQDAVYTIPFQGHDNIIIPSTEDALLKNNNCEIIKFIIPINERSSVFNDPECSCITESILFPGDLDSVVKLIASDNEVKKSLNILF